VILLATGVSRETSRAKEIANGYVRECHRRPAEFAIRLVHRRVDCARNLAFTWETKQFRRDRTDLHWEFDLEPTSSPGEFSPMASPRLVRSTNWMTVVFWLLDFSEETGMKGNR